MTTQEAYQSGFNQHMIKRGFVKSALRPHELTDEEFEARRRKVILVLSALVGAGYGGVLGGGIAANRFGGLRGAEGALLGGLAGAGVGTGLGAMSNALRGYLGYTGARGQPVSMLDVKEKQATTASLGMRAFRTSVNPEWHGIKKQPSLNSIRHAVGKGGIRLSDLGELLKKRQANVSAARNLGSQLTEQLGQRGARQLASTQLGIA